jgi:hypothetical protein
MAGKSKVAALPFLGVSEGIDLVKKVWGVTGLPTLPTPTSMAQFATRLPQTLPSMIAPTLDVEELDKRITDLRAVEQWLNLNLSMLRTTVQSLEVQRNTIATLKSFGGAMLSAGPAQVAPTAAATWPYSAQAVPAMPGAAPMAAAPAAAPPAKPKRRGARATAAAAAAALPLNPTAWWTTLQEQFTKIAATAAAEAQAAAREAAAQAAAEKRDEQPKPAAKAAPRKRKRRPSARG